MGECEGVCMGGGEGVEGGMCIINTPVYQLHCFHPHNFLHNRMLKYPLIFLDILKCMCMIVNIIKRITILSAAALVVTVITTIQ